MRESVALSGVVLKAQPIGEFDKRLVILTKERGKITVFAHGVRRVNSSFLASCNPFVFANFHVYEGREAYSLQNIEVKHYFSELASLDEGVYLAFYCLELADYYGREGLPGDAIIDLLFLTFRAILKEQLPLSLIRRIFTCRFLTMQGEFRMPDGDDLSPGAKNAIMQIASCQLSAVYSLLPTAEVEEEIYAYIDRQLQHAVDRPLKSMALLP